MLLSKDDSVLWAPARVAFACLGHVRRRQDTSAQQNKQGRSMFIHSLALSVGRGLASYCESANGALREGPPFHGSRSLKEIKIQNASCQMGCREVTGR